MATRIGAVSADFEANTVSFERGVARATAVLRSNSAAMNRSLGQIESGFNRVRNLAALFGVSLGVGALVAFYKQALDTAGGLGELAEQFGTTAKNLQVYQFGAVQAGVTTEDLRSGLQRLSRSIGDAANGEKEALDAFNALGIGVLDQAGKVRSTDAVLRDLADAYQKSGDKAKFVAEASRLGGRSFQQLLPLIAGGSRGFDDMADAAQRAGAVLTDEQVAAADAASDAVARLEASLSRMAQATIARAAPAIETLAKKVLDFFEAWANGPTLEQQMQAIRVRLAELRDATQDWNAATADQRDEIDGLVKKYRELRDTQLGLLVDAASGSTPIGGKKPAGPAHNPPAKGDVDKRQAVIDKLNAEIAAVGKSSTAMKIYNDQKAAGVKANSEFGQQIDALNRKLESESIAHKIAADAAEAQSDANKALIDDAVQLVQATRTPAEEFQKRTDKINLLLSKGFIDGETATRAYRQALVDTNPVLKGLQDSAQDFGQAIGTAFEDAIINAKSFGDVVVGLIQDIQRIILRSLVTKPLEGLVGSGLTALLGGLAGGGTFTGGTADLAFGSAVSGFFATGGDVFAGRSYVVGEQGPEIFQPKVAGSIVPNGEIGGGSSGGNTFFIDARGADREGLMRLEKKLDALAGPGRVEQRAVNAVYDNQRRNRPKAIK